MNDTAPAQGRLLARNAALNLIGQGLPLVVAVAATPFVVRGLGPERYGILSMAWVVLGYFGIFDLGLGRATTKFVAAAIGSGREERVPVIAWSAVLVQTALGVLAAAILAATTPLLVTKILNIPAGLLDDARSTFYIMAISIPAVLISGSFRGVLEAAQRFDLVNVAATPLSAANFLLPVVGIALGWRLPAIVGLLVASRVLGLSTFYLLCVRVYPSVGQAPRFHATQARVLLGFGGWVTVSSIVGPILLYVDRFMIGVLLTMAAVAYYTAPYEMVIRLLIVPVSVASALFPALSSVNTEGRPEVLGNLVAGSVKYLLLALGPAIVVLLALAPDILRLWLGPDFAQNSALALRILALGVLANSLAQVPFALIQGFGRPDVTAKIHLVELPLQIMLAWTLVRSWGLPGAALAWSVRASIDMLLLFIAAGHLNSVPTRSFVKFKVPHLLGLLTLFSCLGATSGVLLVDARVRIVALTSLLLTGAVLTWRYLLDDRDRTVMARLLWIGERDGIDP